MNALPRPGLYITREELSGFRARVANDPLLCGGRDRLVGEAEAALEGALPNESYAMAKDNRFAVLSCENEVKRYSMV